MLDDESCVILVGEDSYHNNVNTVFILADIQNRVFTMGADAADWLA